MTSLLVETDTQKTSSERETTGMSSALQETALHLHRLRMIQAVCEERTEHPSFLTICDVQLALICLDRYFTPRFAERGLDLAEVRETIRWAALEFAPDRPLEDVIGTLVVRLFEAQVLARQAAKTTRRAS
jgi:hypothetical protein